MRIIHMLQWQLKDIEKELEHLSYQGFDYIQINPIQPLKEENPNIWWLSYQPIGFRIGNCFGTKEDLQDLCNSASIYNIKIVADVICNHMAGRNDGSLNPHENVDYILKSNPYFWKEMRQITSWKDRQDVINHCMGLPGLNTTNYDLQNLIADYLNTLIDCGVNGFRFDAAKNIALPQENCDFWPRVIYMLKKYNLLLYGELIFGEELIDEYTNYLKVAINHDYWNKQNTIRYVESHDSYYDLGYTKNIPSNDIAKQYYHLCTSCPNTLFFTRPFDNSWQDNNVREGNKLSRKP